MKDTLNKIALIGLIIFSFALLSSCGGKRQRSLPTESSKKQQIPFRITWTDYSGRGVTIQKIVDLYNNKSENNYEIVLQSGNEDIVEIEKIILENESVPILVLPYRYVKYLGDKGLLEEITDSFQKEKELFYPELWNLGTINGELYGIPWVGHSIGLIYNKDLLKQADVEVQSINSLEALLRALEAVEGKTAAKGIGLIGANHNDISWMVNQFIYGFGSLLVDESGRKVAVNNEKAKAAIEFYKNKLGHHAQPTWHTDTGIEVMSYFRKQEIAFEFQGVWGVTDIKKNGSPFEVGIINLEDLGLFSEVGPMMLSIPKNMEKDRREDTIRFIEFMISQEAQKKIMDGEYSPEHDEYYPFRVPVRMDFVDSMIFKEYIQYKPFIKGFRKPSIDVPVPKWQIIKDTYYAPGLSQVMKSEVTIDDFLRTIETKGNEVLNR